ncbi:MAG: AMP-binding protein [Lewinellaceae bacterium]|nr:AMP-binding protein [Saprospiraceae bacterium]MCB9306484.1 AMP-binding protein [Lewinellaceae bacterium]MCB9355468.1 AMP-binding protein [Lewinellaceae bacterium]
MDKPWLQHYPGGVPANIDPDKYPNVIAMVEECFRKYRNLPAFICMGKTLTFGDLDVHSRHFAAYLQSRGLEPGDRIALMMPNLLQYPIALFGALRAGLILVNTNPLYTPREMRHQFTDSGAKAVIIAENFAANLQQILGETQIKTVIVTSIGEMLGLKGVMVNFVVRKIRRMVPKFDIPNTVQFGEALKMGRKFTIKPFPISPDDTVALQYTGGTTGVAKGAMLTNRNLVANMMQIGAWLSPVLPEGKVVALCPLPMYHIFAFTVNCLAFMNCGARNILITNARDLKALIKDWRTHNPNVVTGVNTLFNGLLNHPDFAGLDFSELKAAVGGGMAVQRAVAERWQQVTGCQLTEGYGLTESSPVLSVNPVDKAMRLGTIGMPVPSTDMRICDEKGNALPPGGENVGEIQARGPQVMKGYWQRPEATADTIRDGWLCTGDIGFMHPDGFFQIVDRKKDMILVSGFNVYPNEVEDVLAMHPKVREVCALGVPDEKSGEVVKVFIVKKDPSLTEKEVKEFARENLTAYKVPKHVEFKDELPKTNIGKILRRALRETK